jgi:large subunit ribosomal protein L25
MSQITLNATTQRPLGSRPVRRLRAEGQIPGVVYGEGTAPIAVAVDAKAFRTAVGGEHGLNTVLSLTTESTTYTVMARQIQKHPVKNTVAHVDFQVVDLKKGVVVEVPVHVIGDAVDVRHHDWEVDQKAYSMQVRATPDAIPTFVTVDISELKVGGAIRVSDVALPAGVVPAGDPAATIVGTRAGRAAKTSGNA